MARARSVLSNWCTHTACALVASCLPPTTPVFETALLASWLAIAEPPAVSLSVPQPASALPDVCAQRVLVTAPELPQSPTTRAECKQFACTHTVK